MMNTAIKTGNIPFIFAYDVEIGVDTMNKTNKNISIEVQNAAEFGNTLKVGIYKSLCEQGIISSHTLMKLMQMQRREKLCR